MLFLRQQLQPHAPSTILARLKSWKIDIELDPHPTLCSSPTTATARPSAVPKTTGGSNLTHSSPTKSLSRSFQTSASTSTAMGSQFWPKPGSPGILHHYTETLTTFEYTPSQSARKPHTILFIGGLGDGLATTSYTCDLVTALAPTEWSLFSLNLSSSYTSWGTGHLDRDTDEIAQAIKFIKSYKSSKFASQNDQKFVLMGHSTGSQCVLHYLYRPNPHQGPPPSFDPYLVHCERPVLDGAIMQAPVSDRQAIQWIMYEGFLGRTPAEMKQTYDTLVKMAKDAVASNSKYDTILPMELTSHFGYGSTPMSARRFLSLVSPDSPASPGEDDLFSSDLSDETLDNTFGLIARRGLLRKNKLVVLMSGKDQSVPDWVDKIKLLGRWKEAADNGGKVRIWDDERSGLIPNASHALSNDDQAEPRQFLVRRVMSYLDEVVKS
ncbi:Protein of unknown function (DUF1749) domain containing protein [Rhypophila sp. PSN 637]